MSIAETGSGFITGTDPRSDPPTAQSVRPDQQHTAQPPVQIVMNTPPAQEGPAGRFYSEEQVQAMRAETDQRIAAMGEQLQQLQTEREQREAERQAEQERLANELRAREEEQMDVRQLLERRDAEWQDRWNALEQQRERDLAIFDRERQWNQLQDYRRDRIEQEQEFILPELRDLIQGTSVEEIDSAVETMKQRSAAILVQIQDALASSRPPLRGASLTGQPSMGGPLEQQPNVEQLSVQQIKDMDNQTYSRYRDRLMQYTRRSQSQ